MCSSEAYDNTAPKESTEAGPDSVSDAKEHPADAEARPEPVPLPDAEFKDAFSVATVSKDYLARYYLRALEAAAQDADNPEFVPERVNRFETTVFRN